MATKGKVATKSVGKKCIFKGCNLDRKSRGLCARHYQSAGVTVDTGKTTWAELEKLGMVLPVTQRSTGFLEALQAKKAAAKGGNKAAKSPKRGKPKPAKTPAAAGGGESSVLPLSAE